MIFMPISFRTALFRNGLAGASRKRRLAGDFARYIVTSWISATSILPSPMIGQALASSTARSMLSAWMIV
jgi:hypothetical protein